MKLSPPNVRQNTAMISVCRPQYSDFFCGVSSYAKVSRERNELLISTSYIHWALHYFLRQTTYMYNLLQIRLGRISSTCQLCCVHQPQGFKKSAPFSYLSVDGDIAQCVMSVLDRVLYQSATNGNQLCENLPAEGGSLFPRGLSPTSSLE